MILISRAEWRTDKKLPRRGHRIGALRRTEVYLHHTVIVDADAIGGQGTTVSLAGQTAVLASVAHNTKACVAPII